MTGWRNAGWGLLVLTAVAALAAGPALLAGAAEAKTHPVDGRLDVGYGASIDVPPGSRLEPESRPGTGDVTLTVGSVRVQVAARPVTGDDPAAYLAHARTRLDRDGRTPIGPPEPFVRGERGPLTGGGCYAALTDLGIGVLAIVTGVADCAAVPDAVWQAVSGIEVVPL